MSDHRSLTKKLGGILPASFFALLIVAGCSDGMMSGTAPPPAPLATDNPHNDDHPDFRVK